MLPIKQPLLLVEVGRSGRRAAVVSIPPPKLPKAYTMPQIIDDEIRVAC